MSQIENFVLHTYVAIESRLLETLELPLIVPNTHMYFLHVSIRIWNITWNSFLGAVLNKSVYIFSYYSGHAVY